jgi:hypothetical protein
VVDGTVVVGVNEGDERNVDVDEVGTVSVTNDDSDATLMSLLLLDDSEDVCIFVDMIAAIRRWSMLSRGSALNHVNDHVSYRH